MTAQAYVQSWCSLWISKQPTNLSMKLWQRLRCKTNCFVGLPAVGKWDFANRYYWGPAAGNCSKKRQLRKISFGHRIGPVTFQRWNYIQCASYRSNLKPAVNVMLKHKRGGHIYFQTISNKLLSWIWCSPKNKSINNALDGFSAICDLRSGRNVVSGYALNPLQ